MTTSCHDLHTYLITYIWLSHFTTIGRMKVIFQGNPSQETTRGPCEQFLVHLSRTMMVVCLVTAPCRLPHSYPSPPTPLTLLTLVSRRKLIRTIHPYSILIVLSHYWLQSEQWIKSCKIRCHKSWSMKNWSTAARTSHQTERVLLDMWQICEYIAVQWLLTLTFDMYCTEVISVIVVGIDVMTVVELSFGYLVVWDPRLSRERQIHQAIHVPAYQVWFRPWTMKVRRVSETWWWRMKSWEVGPATSFECECDRNGGSQTGSRDWECEVAQFLQRLMGYDKRLESSKLYWNL